jgi:predicted nuclease of predicted toxin-antitoxin system
LRIYFDENFSPYLAKGLHSLQEGLRSENVEVLSTKEVFGQGAEDAHIVSVVAQKHGSLITQDLDFRRLSQLAGLLSANKIGVFIFRPPRKFAYKYWEWVKWIVTCWPDIKEISIGEERPFIYQLTPRSKKPELVPKSEYR